ncbi:MAG: hypothetical protein ACYDGN_14805 [Acidimicrobiales bacterium]
MTIPLRGTALNGCAALIEDQLFLLRPGRGGLRSRRGPNGRTKDQVHNGAKK